MPGLIPCSRREFIRKLKALGYAGPYAGSNHSYMVRTPAVVVSGAQTVTVPNTELDVGLLTRVLRQSQIDRDDFTKA
jgi:predicted RNA binding protein YcfA (HicA-like mRNA interferase family)